MKMILTAALCATLPHALDLFLGHPTGDMVMFAILNQIGQHRGNV